MNEWIESNGWKFSLFYIFILLWYGRLEHVNYGSVKYISNFYLIFNFDDNVKKCHICAQ